MIDAKQIEQTMALVSQDTIKDIQFAQEQMAKLARRQLSSIQDTEVETLPGVILGHRNIPINHAYLKG